MLKAPSKAGPAAAHQRREGARRRARPAAKSAQRGQRRWTQQQSFCKGPGESVGKGAQLVQQTLKRVLEVERTVAAVAYASSESVAADQQPEPGEEEEAVEPEAVHAEKVHRGSSAMAWR